MTDTTTTTGRSGLGLRGVLAWLVILGLLGLVAWLAAERNARGWYLVPDEGRLVVMRGVLFPVGRHAFKTSEPSLAEAYAPVVPPPGAALPAEQTFEERALLDQALFDLLAGWAREDVASGDPARLERGLGYLARAERLPGLSPAQRDELAGLRADSGYHEARRLLGRAVDELRAAAEKLRIAASSRSAHATEAGSLLREVTPAVDAATGALRAAGDGGPRPAVAAPRPPRTDGAPSGPDAAQEDGPRGPQAGAADEPQGPPDAGPR